MHFYSNPDHPCLQPIFNQSINPVGIFSHIIKNYKFYPEFFLLNSINSINSINTINFKSLQKFEIKL